VLSPDAHVPASTDATTWYIFKQHFFSFTFEGRKKLLCLTISEFAAFNEQVSAVSICFLTE